MSMDGRLAWVVGTIYYAFGALASLLVGRLNSLRLEAGVILSGLVISAIVYYFQEERRFIQIRYDTVKELLEDFLLPKLISEYSGQFADPPEFRANVMLLKRRHIWPFGKGRFLWPWKRSLKVDFSCGDYGENDEEDLIWAVDEGVCGTAIEYNRKCWSDLENVHIHEWDMTPRQLKDTEHLGSVISVPIYRADDEEKSKPIGVLNVDSRSNMDETHLDEEDKNEIILDYAIYIGTLP